MIPLPPRPAASDDFQPDRALNAFLFCEHRRALHRIEQSGEGGSP